MLVDTSFFEMFGYISDLDNFVIFDNHFFSLWTQTHGFHKQKRQTDHEL